MHYHDKTHSKLSKFANFCLFNWTPSSEKDVPASHFGYGFMFLANNVNSFHDQSLISLSTKEPSLKIPVPNFCSTIIKTAQNFQSICKIVLLLFVSSIGHDERHESLSKKEPLFINSSTILIKISQELSWISNINNLELWKQPVYIHLF